MCCCITTWAASTARWEPGVSRAAAWGRSRRRWPPRSRQRRRIRSGAPVDRILVRNGRACGVVLENGEELQARIVVSNLDVRRTFLETMDAARSAGRVRQQVRNFKIRGSSGKLNIALDGLPRFPAIPQGSPSMRGDLHVTDTIEMLERAYDDWKEGRWSRAPYIDMLMPSQIDPTMAPAASTTCRCSCSTVPTRSRTANGTPRSAQAFGRTVIDTIAEHSPDFKRPDPARRDPHALGHRERGRADRGQYLPGRTDFRSAAVQPADPGLCAVPRAGARHVHVRLEHSSRVAG